jgi:hypothetical protein
MENWQVATVIADVDFLAWLLSRSFRAGGFDFTIIAEHPCSRTPVILPAAAAFIKVLLFMFPVPSSERLHAFIKIKGHVSCPFLM